MSEENLVKLKTVLENLLEPNSAVIKQAELDLATLQTNIVSFLNNLCLLVNGTDLTSPDRKQTEANDMHNRSQAFFSSVG